MMINFFIENIEIKFIRNISIFAMKIILVYQIFVQSVPDKVVHRHKTNGTCF